MRGDDRSGLQCSSRLCSEFVSLIIHVLLASPILIVMTHPVKYALFIFAVAFFYALTWLLRDERAPRDIKVNPVILVPLRPALLCLSLASLILYISDTYIPYLRAGLAVLTAYTVPGYALVELFRFPRRDLNLLEKLCFSFGYSIFITALLSLIFVPLGRQLAGLACSVVFLGLALALNIDWIVRRSRGQDQKPLIISLEEAIALALSCAFFLFVVFFCYPDIMNLLGLDVVEMTRQVEVWLRTPHVFSNVYPGFTLSESVPFLLANPSLEDFQTIMAFLSIFTIPSFFLVVKKIFKSMDRRAPTVAMLLFSFLAGLGWIYIVLRVASIGWESYFDIMKESVEKAYLDIWQGGNLEFFLWFRARSAALALLMLLIYSILTIKDSDWKTRLNIGLLATTLFFVHVVEFVLLVFSIPLMVFLDRARQLKLRSAIDGFLCSWLFTGLIYLVSWIHGCTALLTMVPFSLMILTTGICLLVLGLMKTSSGLSWRGEAKIYTALKLLIVFTYVAAIPAWLSQVQDFSFAYIEAVGFLPWFFYSVLLGLVGPLAVIGVGLLLDGRGDVRTAMIPIVSFVIASFITGRLLSVINIHIIFTGYTERRFLKYMFVFLLPLASLGMIRAHGIVVKANGLRKKLLPPLLVGLIALPGSFSAFLSVEKWALILYRRLSDYEQEAVAFLNFLVDGMYISRVLTFSRTSVLVARRAGPTHIIEKYTPAIWASSSPELAFSLIYDDRLRPGDKYIVYLHRSRDTSVIKREYGESFLYSFMLPLVQRAFENPKISIYLIPQLSPPMEDADVMLVVPEDRAEAFLAYVLLSLGRFTYTSVSELDPYALNADVLILPSDRQSSALAIDYLSWVERGGTLVLLNDGDMGDISRLFLAERLAVSVKSPGAYIMMEQGELTTNCSSITGQLEFELINHLDETAPHVIADDNLAAFWEPKAWGKGTLGVPVICDDPNVRAYGEKSLRIDVGPGEKAQWALVHYFEPPVNWESYDFISFYWYGRGDSLGYVVVVKAPDDNNRMWFFFRDTWLGWNKVILPLRGRDGVYRINGVLMHKITRGSPDLSNVTFVCLKLAGNNLNVQGTWYLDRLALDLGRWVNVSLTAWGAPRLSIQVLDKDVYKPICVLHKNATLTIPPENVVFSDGNNGTVLYGPGGGIMRIEAIVDEDEHWTVDMAVKIPPSEAGPSSRLKLKIDVSGLVMASNITINGESQVLPYPVNCTVLRYHDVDVLAWYTGDGPPVPLLMANTIGNGTIFFVNAEPLLALISHYPYMALDVFQVLWSILEMTGLQRGQVVEQVIGSSHVVFMRGRALGRINIHHNTIILTSSSMNITLGETTSLTGVTALRALSDDGLCLLADEANFTGEGFYLALTSKHIELEWENAVLSLVFQNGTCSTLMLDEPGRLTVSGESVKAMIRTPEVEVEGELLLKDAFVRSYFEARFWRLLQGLLTGEMAGDVIKAVWRDIRIVGEAVLDFVVGSGPCLVTMKFRGDVELIPPELLWDEWSSLFKAWPWFLLASAVTLIYYFSGKLKHMLGRSRTWKKRSCS